MSGHELVESFSAEATSVCGELLHHRGPDIEAGSRRMHKPG